MSKELRSKEAREWQERAEKAEAALATAYKCNGADSEHHKHLLDETNRAWNKVEAAEAERDRLRVQWEDLEEDMGQIYANINGDQEWGEKLISKVNLDGIDKIASKWLALARRALEGHK